MCRKHANVYLTLAWLFNKLVHHNKVLAWLELEEMRIDAGIEKILYGSDFPATPNNKEVIDLLKKDQMPLMLRLSGENNWPWEWRAQVLGLNAARVLNLRHPKLDAVRKAMEKSSSVRQKLISMPWSDEALATLNTIPAFVQKSAITRIESYAQKNTVKLSL